MARTTWGPLSTDEQNQIEFAPVGEPGVLVAGTAGGLLKRNANGTIGNSILSESGSVLTAAGRLVINGGTVTASTPVLDLTQTWNYAAAGFEGISLNFTNTSSAIGSFPLILKSSGTAVFSVRRDGVFGGAGECRTSAQFGIGASGFGNASDTIWLRDAANTWGMRNGANAQTLNVYGTYTDASNYRRLRSTMTTGGAVTISAEGYGTGGSGNTLVLQVNAVNALSFDSAGTTATFAGTAVLSQSASLVFTSRSVLGSPSNGEFLMRNSTGSDADFFLKLGVNTSAAAGIKRVGTVLQSRLNDDSAFATIQGKLRTDNAYAAGAPGAATGTVTITDSTGTAYRIPVLV